MGDEKREIDCFSYCITEAFEHIRKDEISYAAVYLENAARSLRVVNKIREDERCDRKVCINNDGVAFGGYANE